MRPVALPVVLWLAGCAVPPPAVLHITGRLDAPSAAVRGAPADWVVELRDDSTDELLAEQRGRTAAGQPPIPFELGVAPVRIESAHRHSVRGALRVQGELRWLSAPRPVDLSRPASIDIGSLPLLPHVSPGAFASVLDCGGRRISIGYVGERLRLIDGPRTHELVPVPGGPPQRYELAGDPATFVVLDDSGATVSLQARPLPHCSPAAR